MTTPTSGPQRDAIDNALHIMTVNINLLLESVPRLDAALREADPTFQPEPVDEPLAGLWALLLDLTELVEQLSAVQRTEVLDLMAGGILLPAALGAVLRQPDL